MRGIKVRCWDHAIKRMFVPSMINEYGDVRHTFVAKQDTPNYRAGTKVESWLLKAVPDSFTLMFFTGVRDWKLRDIFHDDIIKTKQGTVFLVEYNSDEMQWALTQINKSTHPECQGDAFRLEKYMTPNMEVIGNIHQNPELILTNKL